MSAQILLNTQNLKNYAQRLHNVNERLVNLDFRMDSLYLRLSAENAASLFLADSKTGYSFSLKKIISYLVDTAADFESVERHLRNQDPSNFEPVIPAVSIIGSLTNSLWNFGNSAISSVVETVSTIQDLVSEGGALYKPFKIACAAGKVAIGVGLCVAAAASILFTAGTSTPVAMLTMIYEGNKAINGVADLIYAGYGQYDNMGKTDALKDTLVEGGGIMGEYVGNKKLGEQVGEGLYGTGNILLTVVDLQKSTEHVKDFYDKYKDSTTYLQDLDVSEFIDSGKYIAKNVDMNLDGLTLIKNAGSNPVSALVKSLPELRYQATLYKYAHPANADTASFLYDSYKSIKNAMNIGDDIADTYGHIESVP